MDGGHRLTSSFNLCSSMVSSSWRASFLADLALLPRPWMALPLPLEAVRAELTALGAAAPALTLLIVDDWGEKRWIADGLKVMADALAPTSRDAARPARRHLDHR